LPGQRFDVDGLRDLAALIRLAGEAPRVNDRPGSGVPGYPARARSVGFGGDGRLSRKRAVGSFGVAVVGTVAGEVGETFVAMHEVVGDQSPSK